MGNMKMIKKPKIILVPYPAQGHVTPMLMLATAFSNRGFDPVVVMPDFIHRRIMSTHRPNEKLMCMSIPTDGLEEDKPVDFFDIENAMENNMPIHLEGLVVDFGEEVGFIIVDLLASWAIQVGNRCGIRVVGFWPAMLATYRLIAAIPDMLKTGLISDEGSPQQQGKPCVLPNQPMLSTEDLPWLIGSKASQKGRFKFWRRTLDRSTTLRWLLVNSFPDEYYCNQNNNYINYPLVVPIGPLSKHAITKNPSFWEEDRSCLEWLGTQQAGSTVYISFGSWVNPIGEAKIRHLALALEGSGHPFVWVLGHSWREGLPVGFIQRVSKQGKVVSWAPQMEVLRHKAVGCYLTHCGWNSTMEAIQCQKRLLCYPVAGDQFVNCNYIVQVWKIGLRISGFVERDIEEGLRKVMEDNEMSNRLTRLYQRTMGEEATVRVFSNLTAFIHDLIAETPYP